MIFCWVCTECDGVDGVIVISSDSDDDDKQQDEDPFLFPGDQEQHHQNVIDDDDDQGVEPPEDLDFAQGRVVQQRFIYGLTPDLQNQQIFKEILQGTYIFPHSYRSLYTLSSLCLSIWAQRLNVELYTKRSWIRFTQIG